MTAAEILGRIRDVRVLVVGDICLDRWCYYDPSLAEPSRETGIPRTAVVRTEITPGAGGTIDNNLVALGVETVSVCGIVGEDGFGYELASALKSRRISGDLLLRSEQLATFTYTKLINEQTGIEDLARVDFVNERPVPAEIEKSFVERLQDCLRDFDAVLVSDQAETDTGGVVTAPVRELICRAAAEDRKKVFWVDSRRRPELFRAVVLKPNESEADEACMRSFGTRDYDRLLNQGRYRLLVVTHGARGAQVLHEGGEEWVDTRKVAAVDICGAGDSFSAGAATALAAGAPPIEAARFGNLVASITVTKHGTGTAAPDEVLEAEREWSATR